MALCGYGVDIVGGWIVGMRGRCGCCGVRGVWGGE